MKNTRHLLLLGVASAVLAACTSVPLNQPAPVIDRLPTRNVEGGYQAVDGYYTVVGGDTLYKIALEFGLDWRELARANNITDPNRIFVGQRLKVEGISSAPAVAGAGTTTDSNGVEVTPVAPAGGAKPVEAPKVIETTPVEPPKPFAATLGFVWPHPGEVLQGYKAGSSKGLDIAAKVGDPVVAAQAGRVVYSGNALRGYGNLIILKHDNNLLTAYAHNKTLLVKEGDPVTKGQKIAEAGQSDADRPKLHFEVRKQGKPVDPMDYLPKR
ncbi:MAG TPA: peptidoglycan DD-metalloendopeptidase family protein [Limnobacter sp.]|uniref:peptidoglycan DD-metalloendopeptidase family protein n=1 Tax=Limnobacter sp. TaxID=2003368 RepID=UPI002ED9395B